MTLRYKDSNMDEQRKQVIMIKRILDLRLAEQKRQVMNELWKSDL